MKVKLGTDNSNIVRRARFGRLRALLDTGAEELLFPFGPTLSSPGHRVSPRVADLRSGESHATARRCIRMWIVRPRRRPGFGSGIAHVPSPAGLQRCPGRNRAVAPARTRQQCGGLAKGGGNAWDPGYFLRRGAARICILFARLCRRRDPQFAHEEREENCVFVREEINGCRDGEVWEAA